MTESRPGIPSDDGETIWAGLVFGQLGREVATQRWGWIEGQTLKTTL